MMRQQEWIFNWDLEAEVDTTISSVEQLKPLCSRIDLFHPIVDQSTPPSFSNLLGGAMNSHSYVPFHSVREQKLATSNASIKEDAMNENKYSSCLLSID